MKHDVLNELPVMEIREEFFYREYVDMKTGRVIQRDYINRIFWQWLTSTINQAWMIVKTKLAFSLLKGVGDPCPYCNHIIDVGAWKKMFPEADPHEERKAKVASLERTIEDLNVQLREAKSRNNKLAERLATSQPRSATMDV